MAHIKARADAGGTRSALVSYPELFAEPNRVLTRVTRPRGYSRGSTFDERKVDQDVRSRIPASKVTAISFASLSTKQAICIMLDHMLNGPLPVAQSLANPNRYSAVSCELFQLVRVPVEYALRYLAPRFSPPRYPCDAILHRLFVRAAYAPVQPFAHLSLIRASHLYYKQYSRTPTRSSGSTLTF